MSVYTGLCLDGPFNGRYVGIDVEPWQAAHAGYWRNEWANGETVWTMYPPGTDDEVGTFDVVPFAAGERRSAVM